MRVSADGVFAGVEIGEDVLPKRVASRITDIGYLIGEQFSKMVTEVTLMWTLSLKKVGRFFE